MSFRYEKQFTKKQNIVNFMARQDDGAEIDTIGKEVFGESPRQANQSFAKEFYEKLETMLYELILSGHIESEGTRYYFKAAQTDVPMDEGLPDDY